MKKDKTPGELHGYQIQIKTDFLNTEEQIYQTMKNFGKLLNEIPGLAHVQLFGIHQDNYKFLLYHVAAFCSITQSPVHRLLDDFVQNTIEIKTIEEPLDDNIVRTVSATQDFVLGQLWGFYSKMMEQGIMKVQETNYVTLLNELYTDEKLRYKLYGTESTSVH